MNKKMIIFTLGRMLKIEGVLLILPLLTALIYKENHAIHYLFTSLLCLFIGFLLTYKKPKNSIIFAKEGFVIVGLAWIVLSIFGALPFYLSGDIPSYIDSFFEIVSGFTTTGSSILTDVEALSYANLFWRSFSHWIGGMGILVFVVAFLSDNDGRTMHILKAEMPGPIVGKLVSKVKITARLLYIIYAVLTLVEVIFLMFGGMPLFDSLLHSFGTAGTGGFGIKSTSIAYYNSAYIDGVITFFMILFGVNFNLIYFIVIGKVASAFRSEELKWYLGIILCASIAITVNIMPMYSSVFEAFRYAVFQVGSIITTTGYATADYLNWPLFSQAIIFLLMFIGACAGSTGGGMKVSRLVMYFKNAFAEMKRMIHPHSVVSVRFEGKHLDKVVINNIHSYLIMYLFVYVLSFLILSLQNLDFASTIGAVTTCINNIGPGFGIVGPSGNFASLSDLSKLVLSFDMLAGRLEIFPILMLFSKDIWKK